MVADTFIKRPILASVCSLVIILAGAIAIPTLPIAQFPELAPAQVQVTAFYNGANAETVETAVTNPIEQAINGIEGMQYIISTSGNDGTAAIVVTFDVTRNLDIAAVDVQNRISQAEGRLPNEVKQIGISVQKVSTNFVLAAGAYSAKGEFENVILKRSDEGALVRVKDVGRVELGAESYSTAARYQGRDAVAFGVLQLPTANALQVYRDVEAEIKRLSERFPPGLKIEVAFETTTVVAESIREVVTTLAEAIALVVLVMFLILPTR